MSLILITGGARAGKSTFAEQLAHKIGGDTGVCYAATAETGDDEMRARIAAHRAVRPSGWLTVEAPRNVAANLAGPTSTVAAIIVDCLTLLVSNVLLAHSGPVGEAEVWPAVETEVAGLIELAARGPATMIVVTNEVGLGLVPFESISRAYRDLLGRANQRLAAAATLVYLLVSGIPVEIKGGRC